MEQLYLWESIAIVSKKRLRNSTIFLLFLTSPHTTTNSTHHHRALQEQHTTPQLCNFKEVKNYIISNKYYSTISIDTYIHDSNTDKQYQQQLLTFIHNTTDSHVIISAQNSLLYWLSKHYPQYSTQQILTLYTISQLITSSLRKQWLIGSLEQAYISTEQLRLISSSIDRDGLWSYQSNISLDTISWQEFGIFNQWFYVGSDHQIKRHHHHALSFLQEQWINIVSTRSRINNTNELGNNSSSNRTCLEWINQHTLLGIDLLFDQVSSQVWYKLDWTLTWWTELWHNNKIKSNKSPIHPTHQNGYKVDISGHGIWALAIHYYLTSHKKSCYRTNYGWIIKQNNYEYEIRFHDSGTWYHFDITIYHK